MKSKDLTLNGTGNNGKRHRYSFDKNEKFKQGYLDFLKRLGFKEKEIGGTEERFIRRDRDEKDEEVIINIKVSDIKDECWYHKNSKYEIDTFFGGKKIIVLVRIRSKNNRGRLVESIERESGWIIEEELKKRQEKLKVRTFQARNV